MFKKKNIAIIRQEFKVGRDINVSIILIEKMKFTAKSIPLAAVSQRVDRDSGNLVKAGW